MGARSRPCYPQTVTDDAPWRAALAAHAGGRPAEALARLRAFLAAQPDHWPARLVLTRVLTDLGRLADAHAELAAIVDDPVAGGAAARALLERAMAELHDRAGDVDAALRCYARLRELEPEHTDGYLLAGAALARRGRLDEAAAMYQAGAGCQAGRPEELLYNLGLVRRAQEDHAGATAALTAALKLDADYAAAAAALADVAAALALTESPPTPRDT